MALDAATLALTAAELGRIVTDAKIAKIFEPTRDELVITPAHPHRHLQPAVVGPAAGQPGSV